MADTLIPLEIPPGVVRNGTAYQSKGRWYDSQLVRFLGKDVQPIGGWRRLADDAGSPFSANAGVARGALAWRSADGSARLVLGTTQKLYFTVAGARFDLTPVGFGVGRADSGYATLVGSYGDGAYSAGEYGVGSQTAALLEADTWQFAVFGDYLAAVSTSDQKFYVWQGNTAVRPTVPAGAPTSARAVVATPERFLVALGADGNVRKVAWPSQETIDDWTPTEDNTAGDYELTTNGRIRCGRSTRGQTLIWTDADLHAMSYIGGSLVYRFEVVGTNCGIIAPNAVAMIGERAYWWGTEGFYQFDGFVKQIPCTVRDHVFNDVNREQITKVWAFANPEFNEVWWFYPSVLSTEIDRYVVYNYAEDHWAIGALSRTTGVAAGELRRPVMVDPSGLIWEHEIQYVRTGATAPYVESGPFEIGDGERVAAVQRLVPDARTTGDVNATLFAAMDPTSAETTFGPYALAQPTSVRINARQVRLRIAEVNPVAWRLGTLRLGVRESSRR